MDKLLFDARMQSVRFFHFKENTMNHVTTADTSASRQSSLARILPLAALAALIASTVAASALPTPQRVNAAGARSQVTGVVFEDYNANGVFDQTGSLANNGTGTIGTAVDRGIGGVTVTAYDISNTVAASTTSVSPSGAYTLSLMLPGPYRLEFSALPKGYQPSFHGSGPHSNGTSVQFVPDGVTADVNFGIIAPDHYCQNNPTVVANCFHFGGADQANASEAALYSFPYSSGSNSTSNASIPSYDTPAPAKRLALSQIGTTFGLAWARTTGRLFASAFFKKHTGFGPGADGVLNTGDDPGAIYIIDPAASTVINTFTVPGATTNAHDVKNYLFDGFNTAWDGAGKTSLGGLALSPDEATLYVMNLEQRALYALSTTTGAVVVSATVPMNLPKAPDILCDVNDVRPFAVSVFAARGYIGLVCAGPTVNDLNAYVYSFDLGTLIVSPSPVLQLPLNYPRGIAKTDPLVPGSTLEAAWNAWVPSFTTKPLTVTDPGGNFPVYPQPELTSIAFDVDGNMTLGLRDRFGDQMGNEVYSNPALPTVHYYGVSAGDVLRACGNPDTGWTLESNARCGGEGNGPQSNGQGPGGAEFYWRDEYVPYHDEVALGGSAYVPGFPDVLVSVYNPVPIDDPDTVFDGGVRWMNTATGGLSKGYRLYDGDLANGKLFGKAAGIGDLEVLCDAAPIELGDRVWQDTNGNGRQDAGEPGLEGVVVGLYDITGTLLMTTTTSPEGTYYFTATAPAGAQRVQPHTAYKIGVDLVQPALTGYTATLANYGGNTTNDSISDVNDSDGIVTGTLDSVSFVTGGAGSTNHSFDFGFKTTSTTAPLERLGDFVWLDKNKNGLQDSGEPGVPNVTVKLYRTGETTPLSTTTTLSNGLYLFDNLQSGSYVVEFVKPSNDYVWTTPRVGTDRTIDSDADVTTGRTISIPLTAGQTDLSWDAGLVCVANGRVQGKLDSGGLTSIPIFLLPQNAPGAIALMTPTGTGGSYTFTDVKPGTYLVQVHDPYLNKRNYVPGPGSTNPVSVTVTGCDTEQANFSYIKSPVGAIGDFVWYDVNANGKQDEWYDANGDGQVTKNTLDANLEVPLDQYEWWDINGDGRYDGPENEGELRKCGLDVSTPDLLTLVRGDALDTALDTHHTGLMGYYKLFDSLTLGDWAVKFKSDDAGLLAKAKAMFATSKCKPLPGAPPAVGIPLATSAQAQTAQNTDPARPNAVNDKAVTCRVSTPTTLGGALTQAAPIYLDADFGVLCVDSLGTIGDTVWLDKNNNGLQDAGEVGVPGVTVTLLSGTGQVLSTTITSSDGKYLLLKSFPGTYVVQFALPAQAAFTQQNAGGDRTIDSDADVSTGRTVSITLAAGQIDLTWDAGLVCPAGGAMSPTPFGNLCAGSLGAIGDTVWLDKNKNGLQDAGEVGVPGVTVTLLSGTGQVLSTTTTTSDGKYLFSTLSPGTYAVQFALPPQTAFTQQNVGSDRTIDSDANVTTGRTISIPLAAGQVDLTWDAGLVCAANGVVRGKLDSGGLTNIPIFLLPQVAPGAIALMTPTGADGSYVFKDVKPGTYLLQVHDAYLNNRGYVLGPGSTNPVSITVTGCDTEQASFSFVKLQTGAIGDFVWYDVNANGKQDEWFDANGDGKVTKNSLDANNEVPLDQYEWWDINGDGRYDGPENEGELRKCGLDVSTPNLLMLYRGGALTNTVDAHHTGIMGYYKLFDSLTLSDWAVKFKSDDAELIAKAKAMFLTAKCKPLPGAPPAVGIPSATSKSLASATPAATLSAISCGVSTKIADVHTLTPAQPVYLDADFGILCTDATSAIGDFVWLDRNANGIQDIGETGIPNVTVTVHNAAGAVVSSTVTDSSGHYLFDNLVPGSYAVEFGTPPALVCTTQHAGSNPALDSDMDCKTGLTQNVTLVPGETNLTIDAGFHPSNPSAVTLSSFVVTPHSDGGMEVSWRTALERNTFGFSLLRSKTASVADAALVNTQIILAKGPSSYTVIDPQGVSGDSYWLRETELDGATNRYGPVVALSALPTSGPITGPAGGGAMAAPSAPDGNQRSTTTTQVANPGGVAAPGIASAAVSRPTADTGGGHGQTQAVAPGMPGVSDSMPASAPLVTVKPAQAESARLSAPAAPDGATMPAVSRALDTGKNSAAESADVHRAPASPDPQTAPQPSAADRSGSSAGANDAVKVARSGQALQAWVEQQSALQPARPAAQAKSVKEPAQSAWPAGVLMGVLLVAGLAAGALLNRRKRRR